MESNPKRIIVHALMENERENYVQGRVMLMEFGMKSASHSWLETGSKP